MWKWVLGSVLLACSVVAQDAQGNVTIFGDLTIVGATRTTAIRSQSITIDGSISLTHKISGESFTANSAVFTTLETMAISSPTGTVRINGELSLGAGASTNGTISATSFIQQDVRQWALAYHDDFEQHTDGWSTNLTNSCDGVDHHLAGHCNEVNGEVKKTFSGLSAHKYIRVQARYHFLDSWEGETAFAKVGDRTVWTDTNDVRGMHPNAINACGGDHPDTRLSVPLDFTVQHEGDSVTISFGSTLDEHPCNESFGVDDVMVFVR
jgi:hypothetical protein